MMGVPRLTMVLWL